MYSDKQDLTFEQLPRHLHELHLLLLNMKDKLDKLSKSNVVYQFLCPSCESFYIRKTERTIFERTKEHVALADSAIKRYLDNSSEHGTFIFH